MLLLCQFKDQTADVVISIALFTSSPRKMDKTMDGTLELLESEEAWVSLLEFICVFDRFILLDEVDLWDARLFNVVFCLQENLVNFISLHPHCLERVFAKL